MKVYLLTSLACLFSLAVAAQKNDFHLDKEYKASSSGTIDLGSSDARVYVTGSKRSTVHVKIDRVVTTSGVVFSDDEEFTVDVNEEGGNLRIRERKRGTSMGVIGTYDEKYKIEIEAPEGMSLSIRGDDGDYFIKSINGAIELSLDDADVELAACGGNKFIFRMDDGDLKMDQARGSIVIDGDDSDVQIYNGKLTSIHADIDDGDLRIETSLDNKGDYVISSQDGLIALTILSGGGEFDIRHDDGYVNTMGAFKTIEENEHSTKLVLANGSAKVNLRGDDARIKLAVR